MDAHLAQEVLLVESRSRVVRVRCGHDAEPVRIHSAARLEGEAGQPGVAHVAAARSRLDPLGDPVGKDLEVRPLVVGRQERVRLRRPLDLRDLDQRFVAHAQVHVVRVDRAAVVLHVLEHPAVGAVGVVRDREDVAAAFPLHVHPRPEVLGVGGVEASEDVFRNVAAGEDHVAVHVAALARRRVLVRDEGGELAGTIVALGGGDDLGPGALAVVVVSERLGERARLGVIAAPGRGQGRVEEAERRRFFVPRMLRIQQRRHGAEIRRVIGDRVEVERFVETHLEAGRVHQCAPGGEAVGIVRAAAGGEGERVERETGVHVEVAEIGVPFRAGRPDGHRRQDQGRYLPHPSPSSPERRRW